MLLVYYGALLFVFFAIALMIYIFTVSEWCTHNQYHLRRQHPQQTSSGQFGDKSYGEMILLPYTYSSFNYKKGVDDNNASIADCVVCLSGYEEGEEVRKLPRCNHCFHADCIDMWLHSHSDCPICRSPVNRQLSYQHKLSFSHEYDCSQEAMLQIHISS